MFKSKISLIFCIILIFLNIFSASSFASSNIIFDKYNLPDIGPAPFFVFGLNEALSYPTYQLLIFENEETFNKCYYHEVVSNGVVRNYIKIPKGLNYVPLHYSESSGFSSWERFSATYTFSEENPQWVVGTGYSGEIGSGGIKNVIYSSLDLKDEFGNVVFQRPVLSLGEVLEITNPVKKFQITMSGTIIFLVVFLVSLVGFLKAWSLLSNSLRKA